MTQPRHVPALRRHIGMSSTIGPSRRLPLLLNGLAMSSLRTPLDLPRDRQDDDLFLVSISRRADDLILHLPGLPFVFARRINLLKSGLPLLAGMAIISPGRHARGGRRRLGVEANQYGGGRDRSVAFFGVTCCSRTGGSADASAGRDRRSLSQSASEGERSGSSIAPSFCSALRPLLWRLRGTDSGPRADGRRCKAQMSRRRCCCWLCAGPRPRSPCCYRRARVRRHERSLGPANGSRGLGVAVLAGVAAIALGLDTGFLTRVSLASTSSVEQALIDKVPGRASTIPRSFRRDEGDSNP